MKASSILVAAVLVSGVLPLSAEKAAEIPLTSGGKILLEKYTGELETLRKEVVAALPVVDKAKHDRFMELRAKWTAMPNLSDDMPPAERKAKEQEIEQIESESLATAGEIISGLGPALASEALDPKLMRIAILTHGTPRGLAEFAQQGPAEQKLLDDLFGDEALMRQVLEAGGANGGEYGEMMEVYTRILAKSERARERGSIFQRLALGMAIQMPWPDGQSKGGVHGIVYRTRHDVDHVKRYLHYEKAHLDGELDPAFPDFNTWECRFIGTGSYSEEDMTWFR